MEEVPRPPGQVLGKRGTASNALWEPPSLFESLHTYQPVEESSRTSSFWVFTKASCHRSDWLIHWLLMIELSFQGLSPPRRWVGLKVPTLQSRTWLAPLASSPPSCLLSKSHLISITKDTFTVLLAGNSKGLRSSVPGRGVKTKDRFLIVNPTITVFIYSTSFKFSFYKILHKVIEAEPLLSCVQSFFFLLFCPRFWGQVTSTHDNLSLGWLSTCYMPAEFLKLFLQPTLNPKSRVQKVFFEKVWELSVTKSYLLL